MKRIITHGFHLSRRLFKLSVVLIALLLLLARAGTDYVEKHAESIVDQLSIALGVPVKFDSVQAEWRGLSPLVYIEGVRIGVDETLSFESILVKPDVLSSLMGWTIAWSRFDVQGMNIELQELASGSWSIAGMQLGGGGGADYLEAMILESNRVSIVDSEIHIITLRGTRIELELNSLALNYALSFRRLTVDATLGAPENKLTVVAELTGDEGRFFDLEGLAYASIDAENLDGMYSEFLNRLDPDNRIQLSSNSSMKAQFWANLTSDNELAFQGQVGVEDIPEQLFGFDCIDICSEYIASAQMGVYGTYSPLIQFIDIRSPQITLFDDLIQAPDFRAMRSLNDAQVDYSLLLPSMDLSVLMSSMDKFHLPANSLTESLLTLDPSGQVSFLSLELPDFDPNRFRLTGRVNGLDIGSFKGAPAGRNIDADFVISKTTGLISVSGEDSGIWFANIYDDWLDCDQLSATVSWQLDLDRSRIQIASYDAIAITDQGRVNGAFRVDAPLTAGQPVGVDLTLALAMENASVSDHSVLVPDSIPDSLNNWLDNSLISGSVEQGAVFYRGSLRPGESAKRTTQVRTKFSESEIKFMDSWPSLTNIDGELWISDNNVRADSSEANILGLALESSSIKVDIPSFAALNSTDAGAAEIMLDLSSRAIGETNSAIDLVRKTSLRAVVGESLDDLAFKGDLTAQIDLAMPIKALLNRDELDVNIAADIASNSLFLEKQDLLIEEISGQMIFDNSGFHTADMRSKVWDKPVSIQIAEHIDQSLVRVDLTGTVAVEDVATWLKLPIDDSWITGTSEFQGRIDLPTVNASAEITTENSDTQSGSGQAVNRYHFWSNLVGVETGLPSPFDKQPDQPRHLDLFLEIDDQVKTSLQLSLDDSMRSEEHHLADEEVSLSSESKYGMNRKYRDELLFELVQQREEAENYNEGFSSEITVTGASLVIAKGDNNPVDQPVLKPGWFVSNISLSELDIVRWKDIFVNHRDQTSLQAEAEIGLEESNLQAEVVETNVGLPRILGLEPEINLHIQAPKYKDKNLGDANLQIREQDQAWNVLFETDYAEGNYQLANQMQGSEQAVVDQNLNEQEEDLSESERVASENIEISDENDITVQPENGTALSLAILSLPMLTITNLDVDLLKARIFPDNKPDTDSAESLDVALDVALAERSQGEDLNNEVSEKPAEAEIEAAIEPDIDTESDETNPPSITSINETDELDPRDFPALQFDIQSLQMGGIERGSWSGLMQPIGLGLLVSELKGGYGSLVLSEQDGGSSFFWGVGDDGQFTELNLTFNYQDIGDLFRLSGLNPVMSSDEGLLYASLNWDGAPQDFSINTIEGIMGFSAENGAFNTSDNDVPNALLKTIGLFNVGSWTRRLKFDFSDVAADGTPYDRIIGDFVIGDGQISTLTPVAVDLSSGDMLFDGNINLNTEELDARLVITLPARQNMTWVAALVGGLPTAAGVWLVGQIFDDELDSLSSVSYRIGGTLDDPDVSADRIFDSTIKN